MVHDCARSGANTNTGLDLATTVPSPNGPLVLSPQVHKLPSVRIPAVNEVPALTVVHELVPTCTGLDRLVAVPSPICPELFRPHPHKLPSVRIPVVYEFPALTVVHELVPICTGLTIFNVVPVPNCPAALSPQAHRAPAVVIPIVCPLPDEITFQDPEGSRVYEGFIYCTTGELAFKVVPLPN